MQNWIDSDFFGYWKQVHQNTWKQLPESLNLLGVQCQNSFVREPAVRATLAWCETAVRHSLELQSSWLDLWVTRTRQERNSLGEFSELMDQVTDCMDRWTRAHGEFWDIWFEMLEDAAEIPGMPDDYHDRVGCWKSAIQGSLAEQSEWLNLWQEQINCRPLEPGRLDQLADRFSETLQGWIRNQEELWEYGFTVVQAGDPAGANLDQNADAVSMATADGGDDLLAISGIGPALEKKLHRRNIVSYRQIAELTDSEIDQLEKSVVRFPGRIRRENWVGQARRLCAGQ